MSSQSTATLSSELSLAIIPPAPQWEPKPDVVLVYPPSYGAPILTATNYFIVEMIGMPSAMPQFNDGLSFSPTRQRTIRRRTARCSNHF